MPSITLRIEYDVLPGESIEPHQVGQALAHELALPSATSRSGLANLIRVLSVERVPETPKDGVAIA
jgi:hypothetical protein